MENKLIAIEGIDEYMNIVQARRLYNYLLGKGFEASTTFGLCVCGDYDVRDLGKKFSRVSGYLRQIDLDESGEALGFGDYKLFLDSGGILIAQGYKMRTYANFASRSQNLDRIFQTYDSFFGSSLDILIKVCPEVALARRRLIRHEHALNRELKELKGIGEIEYLRHLQELYLSLADSCGAIVVDGQKDEESVHKEIIKELEERTEKNREFEKFSSLEDCLD